MKVFVFPCGSEIGLEIHNALKYSRIIELVGGSSVANHGRYVYKNYIEDVPQVESVDFVRNINDIVTEHNIDLIIPAHDSVVLKLAENYEHLQCKVISSPLATCRVCRSKKNTYSTFQSKVAVPRHEYNNNEIDDNYPLFLKPDVGQGSKGVFKVTSREELEFYKKHDRSLLVLEYLPGDEYTVDCFTDRHGQLLYTGPRKRTRISNGISVDTQGVEDNRFAPIARRINETLVFRGAWFFQLKERNNGELVLLEIAPRIAGSMGLQRNMGVNLALLSVLDAMNIDVQITPNKYFLRMDRALGNKFEIQLEYDDVYIDFDDTLIVKNQVNPQIVAFIWQCVNKGKNVHLLSRHSGDIKSNLEHYRLSGVFDTITQISNGESKANYIKSRNAIFIDDSFAERQAVSKELHIPTFDPSSVECLLDWRC